MLLSSLGVTGTSGVGQESPQNRHLFGIIRGSYIWIWGHGLRGWAPKSFPLTLPWERTEVGLKRDPLHDTWKKLDRPTHKAELKGIMCPPQTECLEQGLATS